MKNLSLRKFPALACLIIHLALAFTGLNASGGQSENTIYDRDPNHLWNRLNETLFVRTAQDGKKYGLNELDLLYWRTTTNLLAGPSHRQALSILDEFIEKRGEKLIRDPLKRALLQRDLWQLFDWSVSSSPNGKYLREREDLQQRLARTIRRVALTTNEIAKLPDNYMKTGKGHLPDLPPDLFQTNGAWVNVRDSHDSLTAPTHVISFDGRSVFGVMLHLPEGREATISYLDELRSFAQKEHVWIYQTNRFSWVSTNSPREVLELNPKLPQFPANTEWALVRQMCVIDTEGRIQPTRITESIQLRRYREIERGIPDTRFSENAVQQFFEFQLDRRHKGLLREIGPEDKGFSFVHFMGKGIDPFESSFSNRSNGPELRDSEKYKNTVLKTCLECHSARGLFSVNSYTRSLSLSMSSQRPANLAPASVKHEAVETVYWKQRRYDWGLLQGLWRYEK